jgi:hypothetical protein
MILIIVNGEIIDLPNDFKISMNLMSPIFSDQGSYSYPFKIQATARNQRILGYIHNSAYIGNKWQTYSCMAFCDGVLLINGLLEFRNAGEEWYEGVIYADNGDFNYNFKNKYLHNYDMGEIFFDTEQDAIDYLNGCAGLNYPDRVFAMPCVYNDLYFDPPKEFWEMMNYNCPTIIDIDTGEKSLFTQNEDGSRTLLIPFLFLKYVLKKLFEGMKYELVDDFFTYEDFNRMVIYNSRSANIGAPWVLITHIVFNMHLPIIKVTDFIKGLETFFAIGFFFDRFRRKVTIRSYDKIIKQAQCEDWSKKVMQSQVILDQQVTGFVLKMTGDDDDDYFVAQTDLEKPILECIKGAVQIIDNLQPWPVSTIGDICWVIQEDAFYEMMSDKTWDVSAIDDDLKSIYYYKGASDRVESSFSTLTETEEEDYPRCRCGNKEEKWREITPRLAFMHLSEDRDYPLPYCRNQTDNISLWNKADNGLFERQWKTFLDWRIASSQMKITRQLDPVEIKELDFSRKYMINGMRHLISSVEVSFGMKTISPATITAFTCY